MAFGGCLCVLDDHYRDQVQGDDEKYGVKESWTQLSLIHSNVFILKVFDTLEMKKQW